MLDEVPHRHDIERLAWWRIGGQGSLVHRHTKGLPGNPGCISGKLNALNGPTGVPRYVQEKTRRTAHVEKPAALDPRTRFDPCEPLSERALDVRALPYIIVVSEIL